MFDSLVVFFQRLFVRKPSNWDLQTFFGEFSSYIETGMGLTIALEDIAENTGNKELRKAIWEVKRSVEEDGENLSMAFSSSEIWPRFISKAIAAGEKAGKLDAILREISNHLKYSGTIERKIASAMLTPKIVSIFLTLGFMVLSIVVVPRFEETYASQKIPLPWFTQVVFFAVNTLSRFWYVFLVLAILAWKWIKYFFNNNHDVVDRWKLKLPFYKDMYYYVLHYRFAKITALLIKSGQSISESLAYAAEVVDNRVFSSILMNASRKITSEGTEAFVALKECDTEHLLHGMMLSYFAAGERVGRLDQNLTRIAEDYDEVIRDRVETFSTMISVFALLPGALGITSLYIAVLAPQVGLFTR